MNDRDRILDRIRKILAKVGRGATEEEAQTAVAMARRLMEEHQLAASDVEGGDDPWEEAPCFEGSRTPAESKFVASILRTHFFVKPIWRRRADGRKCVVLFGERGAVELASWLYVRLVSQYRDLFRSHRAARRCAERERQGYYWGLTHGLNFRLQQSKLDDVAAGRGNLPALADRQAVIDAAFDRRFPGIRGHRTPAKADAISAAGYFAGLADSTQLSVARPLGQAGPAGRALPSPRSVQPRQGELF